MSARVCPNCGTDKIRPAPNRTGLDRVLSLLTIYSYRCQLCGHRFSAFSGRRRVPPRRGFQRLAVSYPVWFRPEAAAEESPSFEGTLVNLTIRGCRLRSAAPPPVGAQVTIEFQPSPFSLPITIDSAVVRSSSPAGVGLRFLKIARSEERRVSRVIDLYLPNPAPVRSRPIETDPPPGRIA